MNMKKIVAMIVLGAALGLSNSGYSNTKNDVDCNVGRDITVKADYKNENDGKASLEGVFYNNSLDDYEDILLQVNFVGDDNKSLGYKVYKFKEDVEAGGMEEFNVEFPVPKETKTAHWTIVCADKK